MSIKLDQDSETASEEEEIEETKSRGGKDDGSGFIDGTVKSDKDTSPTESEHEPRPNEDDEETLPQSKNVGIRKRRRIQRFIGGKKRKQEDVPLQKPGIERDSLVVPLTPISQEQPGPEPTRTVERQERIFHHSGPKNYFLEDGSVHLMPYQSASLDGGYYIRVTQKGKFVGLIQEGEARHCRELLTKGWKSDLRYLGGGRSVIVMHK